MFRESARRRLNRLVSSTKITSNWRGFCLATARRRRRLDRSSVRVGVLVEDPEIVPPCVLAAFSNLLLNGERVLLFAGIASVDGAAVGFVHGLTSLSRRRCGRAADKFAALESSS